LTVFQPAQYKLVTFVDEMKINARKTGANARGISLKGHCAYSDKLTQLESLNQGVSAIVFVSQAQIEYIHLVQGNVTAVEFDIAMREFLEQREDDVKVHALLDNAPVHSKDLMKNVIEEYEDFDYNFLPPNSPDANAAEYIIKSIRVEINNFLRSTDLVDPTEVWEALLAHIQDFNVNSAECLNACNHAFKFLRALRDHPYREAKNIVADTKKQRH
jgi:transposase